MAHNIWINLTSGPQVKFDLIIYSHECNLNTVTDCSKLLLPCFSPCIYITPFLHIYPPLLPPAPNGNLLLPVNELILKQKQMSEEKRLKLDHPVSTSRASRNVSVLLPLWIHLKSSVSLHFRTDRDGRCSRMHSVQTRRTWIWPMSI